MEEKTQQLESDLCYTSVDLKLTPSKSMDVALDLHQRNFDWNMGLCI